jgi:ribonuclease P protein component
MFKSDSAGDNPSISLREIRGLSPSLRLPKSALLRHNRDIERVLYRGKRVQAGSTRVYFAPAESGTRRATFITAGKLPNAVARNRIRRRLREIYRTSRDRFAPGYDYILRADRSAAIAEFSSLRETVLGLADRIPPATEKSEIPSSKS